MTNKGFKAAYVVACLAAALSSCTTVKERSAPCKRSSAVSAFAGDTTCPDGGPVNADRASATAAIEQILVP